MCLLQGFQADESIIDADFCIFGMRTGETYKDFNAEFTHDCKIELLSPDS